MGRSLLSIERHYEGGEIDMNSNRYEGFSLIELLIVVAIISILAAIAIPNLLSSRRAANEGSAQASIRMIHTSEVIYQATAGGGTFGTLSVLYTQGILDPVLGQADTEGKSGYMFDIIDLNGIDESATFGAYGVPMVASGPIATGTRRFGITNAGVLRGDGTLTVPADAAEIDTIPPLGN